jgi:membrane associated rhomboid family serine protease
MLRALPPQIPSREPIFNIPAVVAAAVGVLVLVHALRSVLSDAADVRLLLDLAFIPAQWSIAWNAAKAAEIMVAIGQDGADAEMATELAFASYLLGDGTLRYWTAVTYTLLHGSWAHVLLNSVWLAVFGTPVARRCGPIRFLALGLAAAVGGAAAHFLVDSMSVLPMIGASAAVSGLMGAATRFVFGRGAGRLEPGEWGKQHARQPRLSLLEVITNSRAAMFLGVWFVTNLLFGLLATPLGVTDASIAWEAHIGGFVVGLLIFPLVDAADPIRFQAT